MLCPVCKKECAELPICPRCGFDNLDPTFINRNEANLWFSTVVLPRRKEYEIKSSRRGWRKFLKYIDYYVYSVKEERLTVKNGPYAAKAHSLYQKFVERYNLHPTETIETVMERYLHGDRAQLGDLLAFNYIWELGVALDCIRNMKSEIIDRFSEETIQRAVLDYARFYMGEDTKGDFSHAMKQDADYVLYIRNHYVDCHTWISGSATEATVQVLDFIFMILNPKYKSITFS